MGLRMITTVPDQSGISLTESLVIPFLFFVILLQTPAISAVVRKGGMGSQQRALISLSLIASSSPRQARPRKVRDGFRGVFMRQPRR